MRFAWLREQSGEPTTVEPSLVNRITFIAYNVIWWAPIALGFTKVIDYRTAFIAFFAITAIRAIANVIRNNFLTLEQAELTPFRSP
jgi:hypothetical protein